LGSGTKVWDNVNVRWGATPGRSCIVGEQSYVAYDVVVSSFAVDDPTVYLAQDPFATS
jgi:hypothetical protein